MKNGKKRAIKVTPWLVRQVVAALFLTFLLGVLTGCGIVKSSTPKEETPTCSVVVDESSTPVEDIAPTTEVSTVKIVETTKAYYDCPLTENLQDYIRRLCNDYGVPMSLIIAMIDTESSFVTDVISDTNDYGLMQINEINHDEMYEEYGVTDFLDPYDNVFCGITLISQLYERYQDLHKALMAYNLGITGASELWEEGIYDTEYSRVISSLMEVYDAQI